MPELNCKTCGDKFVAGMFNLEEYEHPETGKATCGPCMEELE